jgi:DNA-binding response OmpR family regulator
MATVLIIEDDPDTREMERVALTQSGHSVIVASNGYEGLRALADRRPSVIVLDLMMPGMDGLTFLLERRRIRGVDSVPVICVSAAGTLMWTEALRLGAIECLPKPTDVDKLCARVQYHCDGSSIAH